MMCRILGDFIEEGFVAKLADDLYCGGDSPEALLNNWRCVLQALDPLECALTGLQSSDRLLWDENLTSRFKSMQDFLSNHKATVLPHPSPLRHPLTVVTFHKDIHLSQDHLHPRLDMVPRQVIS